MDKLSGISMNIKQNNIEKIKELFPSAITEGKIDFDSLKVLLGEEVDTSKEKYQFSWNGKTMCIKAAQIPSSSTLRPKRNKSEKWDTTNNIYIEGDNLEVLKLLQKTYYNRIKMIYIDPPYNTGGDFVYKDNFTETIENYKEQTNQSQKSNPETSGRYHSDWLSMMYPRLLLARNLLSDDGVIFISIDDNELENLIKICNEIFGESNYINTISLFTKVSAGASGGGEDKKLKKNMEYILFYAKNMSSLGPLPNIYKRTELMEYIEQMRKEGKSYKYTNVLYNNGEREYYKTIKDGSGDDIEIYRVVGYEIKTVKQIAALENITEKEVYEKYFDRIMTTTNAQTSIRDRVWEATDSENNMYVASYTPRSGKNSGKKTDLVFMGKQKVLVIWLKDTAEIVEGKIYKKEKIGTFWEGFSWINVTKEGNVRYDNGKKPVALIEQLMDLVADNEKCIVLDFFSGSATTAHAVMNKNAIDGGQRKYIMVQLPEYIKDRAEYKDENFETVCDLGEERLRRSADKLFEGKKQLSILDCDIKDVDVGFKVFALDSTNINAWDNSNEYDENTIYNTASVFKSDRTIEDILYEVMIKYGVFDQPVCEVNVNGKNLYLVGQRYMIVCLEDNIDSSDISEICKLNPRVVVFKEDGFNDDNAKINAEYNLKNAGVEDIKCI